MRDTLVRRDNIVIHIVIHNMVSVSPSILATVQTQWLEALWRNQGVCSNNGPALLEDSLVFRMSVGRILSSVPLTFSLPSKRGMGLCLVSLPI